MKASITTGNVANHQLTATGKARAAEKSTSPEKPEEAVSDSVTLGARESSSPLASPETGQKTGNEESRVENLLSGLMFHILKKGLILGAGELCGGFPVGIALEVLRQMDSPPLHVTDRRIRIKLPDLKHNPEEATKVVDGFKKDFKSLQSASVNEYTGSLTLEFTPGSITPREVVKKITDMGHGESFEQLLRENTIGAKLGEAGKRAIKSAVKEVGKDALLPAIEEHLGEDAVQILDFLL